ncbi:MAG: hypothetical protein ACR2JQ_09070 [Mycobacteriales bacterium]
MNARVMDGAAETAADDVAAGLDEPPDEPPGGPVVGAWVEGPADDVAPEDGAEDPGVAEDPLADAAALRVGGRA